MRSINSDLITYFSKLLAGCSCTIYLNYPFIIDLKMKHLSPNIFLYMLLSISRLPILFLYLSILVQVNMVLIVACNWYDIHLHYLSSFLKEVSFHMY